MLKNRKKICYLKNLFNFEQLNTLKPINQIQLI
jgi:hypothetical protein